MTRICWEMQQEELVQRKKRSQRQCSDATTCKEQKQFQTDSHDPTPRRICEEASQQKPKSSTETIDAEFKVIAVMVVCSMCVCICLPVWIISTTSERSKLPPELELSHNSDDLYALHKLIDAITSNIPQPSSCPLGNKRPNQSLPLCNRSRLLVSILNARTEEVFLTWDDSDKIKQALLQDATLQGVMGEIEIDFHMQASKGMQIQQAKSRKAISSQEHLLPLIFQTVGSSQTECTINLAVYIPACHETAMRPAKSQNVKSHWQPGWGGVLQLEAPQCTGNPVRKIVKSRDVLPHFIQYLRHILGSCQSTVEYRSKALDEEDADAAQLILIHRFVVGVGDLLTSFSRVLDNLPTLIVQERLASHARAATEHLHAAHAAVSRKQWSEALTHARYAHSFAGKKVNTHHLF